MATHSLRVGDHVHFHKVFSDHKAYGTIIGLSDNGLGGEFINVLIEGADKPVNMPASLVYLYARAGATK